VDEYLHRLWIFISAAKLQGDSFSKFQNNIIEHLFGVVHFLTRTRVLSLTFVFGCMQLVGRDSVLPLFGH
jgi:hypothetical protein